MKLSVAICTYNGQAYLQQQLDSLAAQHRQPDELVVGDDSSQDQTLAIIEAFARRVSFPVKILPPSSRLGPAQNFSRTIAQCSGDVILPCDQDDHWKPEKLATFEKLFTDQPDCLLAFSNLSIMQADQTPTGRTFWDDLRFNAREQQIIQTPQALSVLLKRNVVVGTAMAFRSQLAQAALPIPQGFMHDEWLALIAALMGGIAILPQSLVDYRLHASQAVGSQTGLRQQWRQARRIMTQEYFARREIRAQAVADAVSKLGDQVIAPDAASQIQAYLTHARAITKMHQAWLWRIPLIPRELLAGRYHRYDYGLRGVARDLLL